ncbi:D-alanyl-D-alanine carboxypeptidase [Streptomyces sp. NPDC047028]|uniref:D-alanyl-D-alanine carboxypeptidase n=1 Tax=Streptomyces sp. NPDC047028 TaxID=3155793 RepID=UPI0033F1568F
MAGESPDRSKQRESSAEPTPGSGPSVPEARDPRLAVSRERESAEGTPDTSTKILSIRDTKSADDDADLREAVSAWVRSSAEPAAPTEETTDEAEPASAETAEEDEPGKPPAEPAPTDATPEPEDRAPETEAPEDEVSEDEVSEDESRESQTSDADASDDDASDDASADDDPQAADGEDAPQGPRSADDETRTGGAGGNEDAEGEAEAAPQDAPQETAEAAPQDAPQETAEAAPQDAPQAPEEADPPTPRDGIDQPTAVFQTLRPKKPQPDQPTTMLKLGTPSKFVELKPDIPAPTTPTAHVGPERTTQQPLPPKPPLDLLAELTNTPPPPETPVRTIVRRIKIWTPLVLLLAIIFAVVQTLRPLPQPTLDLTAEDNYTFDGSKPDIPWPDTGQAALDVQGIGSFGSSGQQKPVPIASVAKVMTAYIILRDHPLKSGAKGPMIKIDQAAEDQSEAGQESTVHVTAGDRISEREALEGILIASANNVARLLARWDAHSEKAFVAKMNATAKDLGMTNTTYTDPSGLTNTTVSTAVDQVRLAKTAMTEPAFREVAAMMSYDDYKGVNHSNWNTLVGRNNVVGIKTGTTTSAQGNLVFAAKQQVGGETRTVIGAVLRQPPDPVHHSILVGATNAADKLIRAGQGALKSATIIKKGTVVGYVDDGVGGRTPVVATQDVSAAGWAGLKVKLSFTAGEVPHTAKAGTKVGHLTVGDGSAGAVQVPVALEKDLTEPGFPAKLTRLG